MINPEAYALGSCRSEIRELYEYGLRMKSKLGAENVFDYSIGNPTTDPPEEFTSAALRILRDTPPAILHGYTSAPGCAELRAALSDYINKRYGEETAPGNFYVTVGASAALTAAIGAVCTPGEEIVVIAPFFPEYRVFIENAGGRVVVAPTREPEFQPDIEALAAAISPRCAAVIVNSPNNPSGAVYTEESLRALTSLLRRKSYEYGKTIYLISDEPYRELVYDGATVPYVPSLYDDTIVCYSYSKSLSLPGERIGYVMVSPRTRGCDAICDAVAGAARRAGYVCAPSFMQRVLTETLGIYSDISVYDENRRVLLEALTSYGYTVTPPHGAFYLFVKSPEPDAHAFSERAKKYGLLLVPSDSFGVPGYVRLAYCKRTEEVLRSLPRFRELMESYR